MADPKQPSKRNAKAEDAEEPKVDAKQAVAESEAEQPVEGGDKPKADKPKADKPKADEPKAEKPKAARKTKADAAEADEAEADEAGDTEDKPERRRRGAAETTTKQEPATPAPTNDDGLVEVRASARFVRIAPRKARLVMDHVRGKQIDDARAILRHTPRAAASDISKLLESAVANAANNYELDPDELRIHRATVDEGPTIKRFRPRAQGRATPIHKRTSHMTITLTTTADGAASADKPKARK
jgi:ribosomal protein L22